MNQKAYTKSLINLVCSFCTGKYLHSLFRTECIRKYQANISGASHSVNKPWIQSLPIILYLRTYCGHFDSLPSSESPRDFCKACNLPSIRARSSSTSDNARCNWLALVNASSFSRSLSFSCWAKSRKAARTVSGSTSFESSLALLGDRRRIGETGRLWGDESASSALFSGLSSAPRFRRNPFLLGLELRTGEGDLKK